MGSTPDYMPTPDEIKAACAEIRREWTPFIEEHRRVTGNPPARIPGAEMEPEWTDVGATMQRMRTKLGVKPSWNAEHGEKREQMRLNKERYDAKN